MFENTAKQEYIPVGCIPTAAVDTTRCQYQGGVSLLVVGVSLLGVDVSLLGGCQSTGGGQPTRWECVSTGEGLPTGVINLLGGVSLLGGLLTRKRQRASGICLGWLQISLLTGKRKTLQLPLLLPLLRHNKYFFITIPPIILDKSVNIWKKFYNNDDISISLMNRLTQMKKFGR